MRRAGLLYLIAAYVALTLAWACWRSLARLAAAVEEAFGDVIELHPEAKRTGRQNLPEAGGAEHRVDPSCGGSHFHRIPGISA